MTMQRQHFELIAEVLIDLKPFPTMPKTRMDQWLDTVKQFAAQLSRSNTNFNRDRFLRACGVDQ